MGARTLLLGAVALLTAWTSNAQTGLVGGITSGQREVKTVSEDSNIGYHAGLVHKASLPLGLTLQTGLMYNVKGSVVESSGVSSTGKVGYVEIPLQLQWGLDLRIIRPYLFAEPFVGYAVNNEFSWTEISGQTVKERNNWESINRLEYGLAGGAGVELFRFLQVSVRYFWNFDSAAASDKLSDAARAWWEGAREVGKDNFTGIALSVGIFF